MRILQVISYGYLAGGAEKSVMLLKENLKRRGHDVKVISSNHNKNHPAKRFSDIEFPEIDSPHTSLIAKIFKHLWYRPSYKVIKRAVAEFRPDVVHFHVMGQLSPSALFAIGKTPGMLTVHGPEEYVSGIIEWGLPKHLFKNNQISTANLTLLGRGYHFYFRYVQRLMYLLGFRKHIRMLVAPSRYMAGMLHAENYSVPIQHTYNGIELPEHQPLKHTRRLLYVGRLEHVKGIDVLLRAMKVVSRKLPDVHLAIVGDGAMRGELEAYMRQHKLGQYVTFHGWLGAEAVTDQYARTTAVVIPSIWPENLPTVCIEALAMGRPVIGTNSGGIPELIQDGVTGRITPKGNAKELATAIISQLTQPNLEATAVACTASMQDFKVTKFTERLERLYRELLSDNVLEEA